MSSDDHRRERRERTRAAFDDLCAGNISLGGWGHGVPAADRRARVADLRRRHRRAGPRHDRVGTGRAALQAAAVLHRLRRLPDGNLPDQTCGDPMTVYVDDMRRKATVRRLTATWSHLLADDHDELVEFGKQLGLLERWLQYPNTPKEHFDVTESVRQRAIRLGPTQITYRQSGELLLRKRGLLAAPANPIETQLALDVSAESPPAAAPASGSGWPTVATPGTKARRRRHSWEKIKEHWYRCRREDCGLRYENELRKDVGWVRWWHWPDGEITAQVETPECGKPRL